MLFFSRLVFIVLVITATMLASTACAQQIISYAEVPLWDEWNEHQTPVSVGEPSFHVRRALPDDAFPVPTDQWRGKALNVGGSYGLFSGNIFGHVSGQSVRWEGVGLGLTWRTPWSSRLTVGADNIITRGRNPFSTNNGIGDEGAIPYVRYEQDL